jgi:hypothetical protein
LYSRINGLGKIRRPVPIGTIGPDAAQTPAE